jgi:hypothetical protein
MYACLFISNTLPVVMAFAWHCFSSRNHLLLKIKCDSGSRSLTRDWAYQIAHHSQCHPNERWGGVACIGMLHCHLTILAILYNTKSRRKVGESLEQLMPVTKGNLENGGTTEARVKSGTSKLLRA